MNNSSFYVYLNNSLFLKDLILLLIPDALFTQTNIVFNYLSTKSYKYNIAFIN